MLRITIHEEGPATRFLVEGKLVGPWVAELRKCWEETVPIRSQQTVIDLAGVTSVDSHGKDLLAEMHRRGMQLVATGLMTQAIVEDIQRTRG
jgi:ABC-type transporter Mla MlaB component